MTTTTLGYFKSSFILTALGILGAYALGHYMTGTVAGGVSAMFLCGVLSVLEISLSFDNAIVNASVLNRMNDVWRHRFLTWGILIAVFGMRLVFPLLIVGVMTHLGPWDALLLAAGRPEEYAAVMEAAHIPVAAFGGAFLLMVAMKHFFDAERDVFWISKIERPLSRMGRLEASELALAMLGIWAVSTALPPEKKVSFFVASIFGLITFILVEGLSSLLENSDAANADPTADANEMATGQSNAKGLSVADRIHRASFGLFIYLEVLDASFSFDGVVGAFAITTNLFLIAIGLGVGALYVRSLTIMLVERGTLQQYRYLEHGAFWAIGALAVIMFVSTFQKVPEVLTGFIGAAFIGLSLWSSIRYNQLQKAKSHSQVAPR